MPERLEIFHFKDKKSQEAFKINTSETTEFTDCFNSKEPLNVKIEKWRKILDSHISKVFKKIRINLLLSSMVDYLPESTFLE